MNFAKVVLSNKAIVVPVIAWFVAQVLKVIGVLIVERKIDFTRFVGSGGMPSSHSALVVSLSTIVGRIYGWDSGLFAVTVVLALIVMYDAAGIRRAAGKQAKVLNKLIYSNKNKVQYEEKLKELLGHTPFEVLMGAVIGIFFGLYLDY